MTAKHNPTSMLTRNGRSAISLLLHSGDLVSYVWCCKHKLGRAV